MCFFGSLLGNFVQGYKTVFNFITSMIEAVKGVISSHVCIFVAQITVFNCLYKCFDSFVTESKRFSENVRGGVVILMTIYF